MASTVFIDVETSGLNEADRICELALIVEDEAGCVTYDDLCKSPKKISTEAMALHHITNEMIKDVPEITASETYQVLNKYNSEENILVGHHLDFDLQMLGKEGFTSTMKYVDTLRCVKALIPECEQFSLQFLRYELQLYKKESLSADKLQVSLCAHRALSDALHIRLLWNTLLQYATVSELISLSAQPVLMQKFSFGKYSGRYIEEILVEDRGYLFWMMENINDMDEDLRYSIEHYLKELG